MVASPIKRSQAESRTTQQQGWVFPHDQQCLMEQQEEADFDGMTQDEVRKLLSRRRRLAAELHRTERRLKEMSETASSADYGVHSPMRCLVVVVERECDLGRLLQQVDRSQASTQ